MLAHSLDLRWSTKAFANTADCQIKCKSTADPRGARGLPERQDWHERQVYLHERHTRARTHTHAVASQNEDESAVYEWMARATVKVTVKCYESAQCPRPALRVCLTSRCDAAGLVRSATSERVTHGTRIGSITQEGRRRTTALGKCAFVRRYELSLWWAVGRGLHYERRKRSQRRPPRVPSRPSRARRRTAHDDITITAGAGAEVAP